MNSNYLCHFQVMKGFKDLTTQIINAFLMNLAVKGIDESIAVLYIVSKLKLQGLVHWKSVDRELKVFDEYNFWFGQINKWY